MSMNQYTPAWMLDPKEESMNKHVEEAKRTLDLVDVRDGEPIRFIQDDSDYPVDPLDLPDYAPAPGKAATEDRQVEDRDS